MIADAARGADVVIVGGAVMGGAIAYHLAADRRFDGDVLVVEKDPSYRACASALSAASIRQQFSTAINIDISLHGIAFLRRAGQLLEVDGERPEIGLKEGGYLFLATPETRAMLEANHALQTARGADILLLGPKALRDRFPWLDTTGVAAGAWGRAGEGWFDGYGLTRAFNRKARALGVRYRRGEAVAIETAGRRATAVRLADGARLSCGALVVAAGVGAPALLRTAGVDLPVAPRKRMIFTFDCRRRIDGCPLLIDPTGVYVRPEGDRFLCGAAPPPDRDPDCTDFEVDHAFFEETIWPVLARRVPAFETLKPGRAWAGHYDMNLFDRNAFVGRAPGFANLHLASGFSGHGLQQAPAVGRGLAETIAHGRYLTLDLAPLGLERWLENRPLIERNVV